jgi:Protein of unknown function (DUF1761)
MEMNWLSNILAAASTLAVGFVWYHPKVFGTVWMRSIGITPESTQGANMGKLLGFSLLFAFMASIPLSFIVNHDNHTFGHGAFHGTLIGIMMILPVVGTNALYENRNWTYIFVNSGYWVVSFALMGGILRIMQ